MKSWTLQEAFDKVWDHFIVKKNPPSMMAGSSACSYRGCAIAILLPDDFRKTLVEQEDRGLLDPENNPSPGTITRVCEKYSDTINEIFPDIPLNILRNLQKCHDNASIYGIGFHQNMEYRLRDFAETYNLTIPS